MSDAVVVQRAENKFHITYDKYNQYEGLDFDVTITEHPTLVEDAFGNLCSHHYVVENSVYGDDGEFDL